MNYKRIILWSLAGLMVVLVVGSYFWSLRIGVDQVSGFKEKIIDGPHILLPVKEYDFGDIKQSGPMAKRSFEVINNGTEDVNIEKVVTSCSCTTAKVSKNILRVGESAILTVTFDPNYHFESYDQIMRTVTIFSDAKNDPKPEVKIYMKVEYDLGVDKTKYGIDED